MKNILVSLLLLFLAVSNASSKVWINEFMQSNLTLMDDLFEFPDSWVELYNDGTQAVNIRHWSLSVEAGKSGYTFPNDATIPAKGYLLIYCDKEAKGLHTDFRVDSGNGESLYLYNSNGTLEDQVLKIPKQPAPNIARGRISDGADQWAYFVTATPKAKNQGKTSELLLPYPVFSQKGGLIRSNTTLELSLPANIPDGVQLTHIKYTTDGTEPTASSTAYSGPIAINKTTIIRAKIIHPDYLSKPAAVQSYIKINRNHEMPVVSISIDPDYLWKAEYGIYVDGIGNGVSGNCRNEKLNFLTNWRRPMNVELFPKEGAFSVLNQLGELRIGGGCTRSNSQKTFVLYANKRFGDNKRFGYPIWGENKEIKSFMLRNSGNDFRYTHFRDAAIQYFLGGKVDVDYQRFQPSIVYLNGEYWGILNMRERSTEDNVLANHGLEDIDMIENWNQIKAGDKTHWNAFINKIKRSDSWLSYEEVNSYLDVNEYINFMILQMFIGNTDFPHNNIVVWRPRTDEGKWRFLLKDLDFGLGVSNVNADMFTHNMNGGSDPQVLLTYLMGYPEFREDFLGRYAIFMGDLLHKKHTHFVIDSLKKVMEPEINYHHQRWSGPDRNAWNNNINKLKKWAEDRSKQVYAQMEHHFDVTRMVPVVVEEPQGFTTPALSLNGYKLYTNSFDGLYFTDKMFKLKWEGDPDEFYGWEVTRSYYETTTTTIYPGRELPYIIPYNCTGLSIKAIVVAELTSSGGATSLFDADPNKLKTTVRAEKDIIFASGLEPGSTITVYSLNGRSVYEERTNVGEICIPLADKGVYLVKIQTQDNTFSHKVIL